ncbi:MAG: dihydroorotate dehydrogenase electron transfer subunit, partial [Dehalococcoidia bacterium]|nr:dihydroorotate dehydrogenase electron transfer subunit [Dehalococcoidia bacterium]
MIRELATVLSNEQCYEGGYVAWFDAPTLAATGHTPGQFVMVRCSDEGGDPEFSRAFSYHRAEEGRIALLYAVAGRGTAWLAGRRRGDTVSLYGPLGNGFR